jgi:dipeptidyl aminopeptidase/acylaminoacyl peptidase
MRLSILYLLLFCVQSLFAQNPEQYLTDVVQYKNGKPALDFKAIESWQRLETNAPIISNDGKWFSYKTINGDNSSQMKTLTIQSTSSSWKREFQNVLSGLFSSDSKYYLMKVGDSLCILKLGSNETKYVLQVDSYQTDNDKKASWLAWQLKDQTLVLHHLSSGKERTFKGVVGYTFSPKEEWLASKREDGSLLLHELATGKEKSYPAVNAYSFAGEDKVLILKTKSANAESLQWVDLPENKKHIALAETSPKQSIAGYATDRSGQRLVFTLQEKKNNEISNSIWYYKPNMEGAIEKVNKQSVGIDADLFIEFGASFTDDGKYIRFNIKMKPDARKANPDAVKIDVWNYKDPFIQSAQLLNPDVKQAMIQHQPYLTIANIETGKIVRLGANNIKGSNWIPVKGDYALIKRFIDSDRSFFAENWCDSVWLVSLKNGERRFLKKTKSEINFCPNGKYLLHFDENNGHYYSYDIETNIWTNISAKIPVFLGDENVYDPPLFKANGRTGVAGWSSDRENLYIYDTYDLWKVDIHGIKEPVNVTAEYGRKNGLIMRLTAGNYPNKMKLDDGIKLLFTAFNVDNKENGFYQKILGNTNELERLFMNPCIIDLATTNMLPNGSGSSGNFFAPIKAKEAAVWLVRMETGQSGSNYYLTKDLKSYKQLTDIRPHQNYNWYTTELVNFKQADGSKSQGILFKPENFDPNKKYPVIIHYYWQYTQDLHHYFNPFYTPSAWIDIPWFVSRGYLVFTPDNYFTKETRPAGAFNTIEGAAAHLSKLSYVDATKLGIAGHSRAGGYTNYILTHSKRFAAAFEGAGVSNWVSAQLQLVSELGDARAGYEQQEPDLAGDKKVFAENPIMNVDKIRSPLLMFHCKKDGAVPFEQAVELFLAMRRLNKKVWLLQYNNGTHDVGDDKKDQQDLTVRVTQFFDHYLKGAPAPQWMLEGVPAHLKGIETGLELGDPKARP